MFRLYLIYGKISDCLVAIEVVNLLL